MLTLICKWEFPLAALLYASVTRTRVDLKYPTCMRIYGLSTIDTRGREFFCVKSGNGDQNVLDASGA